MVTSHEEPAAAVACNRSAHRLQNDRWVSNFCISVSESKPASKASNGDWSHLASEFKGFICSFMSEFSFIGIADLCNFLKSAHDATACCIDSTDGHVKSLSRVLDAVLL